MSRDACRKATLCLRCTPTPSRPCSQAALTFQAGQIKTAVVANRSQRSHDLNKAMMGVHTGEGAHRISQQQCKNLVSDGGI